MITNDKLDIFETFWVDRELPKFKKPKKSSKLGASKSSEDFEDDEEGPMMSDNWINTRRVSNVVFNASGGGGGTIQLVPFPGAVTEVKPKVSVWSKLAFWRKPEPLALPPPSEPELISVQEFFTHMKNSQQELTVVEARAKGYERAIANAVKAGQHALVEQLRGGLNAYAMETQLVAIGMPKFLTEETVIKFVKQAKKGLRLDWVRNFARTIPDTVVAKMQRANELGLFDNYAVLHYDPSAKSYAETEAEKAAKRDPILFGLMEKRRVLYVVGDWIDEVCDLTMDQLAEQLGKDAVGNLENEETPYRGRV